MVINWNQFYSRISAARLRAAELYLKISQVLTQQHQLIIECFEELYAALRNLELAYEALIQQNQELATARELIEVERRRYQDLFKLVPNAYLVTDRKGIILEANPAAAKLLNVPQRFLVGKPLASFASKEERRVFLAELSKLELSNQGREWEVRLCPRNSNAIKTTLTVTNVHDQEGRLVAIGWLVRDITHSKATEPEWLLTQAVQQATAPIIITSAELDEPGPSIVFVNSAFTQMSGYSLEEITSKTPRILQGAKTDRSVLSQLRYNLSQGQSFEGEIINYRKDGAEYNLQIYCSPIRNDRGEITHFMSIQRHNMVK